MGTNAVIPIRTPTNPDLIGPELARRHPVTTANAEQLSAHNVGAARPACLHPQ
jgi:hypothetical protein